VTVKLYALLWYVNAFVQLVDLITTWLCVRLGGVEGELMPVARYLLRSQGIRGFVLFKACIVVVFLVGERLVAESYQVSLMLAAMALYGSLLLIRYNFRSYYRLKKRY
jgi:hypothetical protein